MFVESEHNFEILREINFSLFGMAPKYRRRADRMKPDDRVLFYVQGLRKWPASATIAAPRALPVSTIKGAKVNGKTCRSRM